MKTFLAMALLIIMVTFATELHKDLPISTSLTTNHSIPKSVPLDAATELARL